MKTSDSNDKPNATPGVGSSNLLGVNICKASHDSCGTVFRTIDNTHLDLGEVLNPGGVIPVLVDALKKKGVRFDESDFVDGEITFENKNVLVLRGAAYEVVHRAFECGQCGVSRKQSALLFIGRHISLAASACYKTLKLLTGFCSHKRVTLPPNDKLSGGGEKGQA